MSHLQHSINVFVINTIDVDVHDVADAALVRSILRSVQRTFKHLAGTWHVQVSASHERGRWDVHVRAAFGHHFCQVLTSPEHLAVHVERRLRAFLSDIVPPLPVVPRRPVLVARTAVAHQRISRPVLVFTAPHRKAS